MQSWMSTTVIVMHDYFIVNILSEYYFAIVFIITIIFIIVRHCLGGFYGDLEDQWALFRIMRVVWSPEVF